MDFLRSSCEYMLGLTDTQTHRVCRNKIEINFDSWSNNALAGTCRLCTLLFYAAAGPNHKNFLKTHAGATYQLSGTGLGNKDVYDFIDTNEGNFKYLALVTALRPDSHKRMQMFLKRKIELVMELMSIRVLLLICLIHSSLLQAIRTAHRQSDDDEGGSASSSSVDDGVFKST